MELLVVDVLEEACVQGVLHSVADDGCLVHALYETHGGHAFAEAGDGGFLLVVFELLRYVFVVVFFLDINLDTEFQIAQFLSCNVHLISLFY